MTWSRYARLQCCPKVGRLLQRIGAANPSVCRAAVTVQFGLIPEFVGRFPCVVHLEALTKDDLRRALVEPKNSLLSQYKVALH